MSTPDSSSLKRVPLDDDSIGVHKDHPSESALAVRDGLGIFGHDGFAPRPDNRGIGLDMTGTACLIILDPIKGSVGIIVFEKGDERCGHGKSFGKGRHP